MSTDHMEQLRDRIFAALARGDEVTARKGIRKLHRHAPAEAAGLLTALEIEAGRAQEALRTWRECARHSPRDPYTIFLRARIHLLMGERRAALDLLSPLLGAEMSPAVAEKVYNLAGQCARFLGRAAEAVAFYERARDAAPDLALRALNASNVLFNRHYLPATLAEDRRAAEQYGAIFAGYRQFSHAWHALGKDRLSIGYLSPDVREHVVLSFSYALMTALDPARFDVTVYALNEEDSYTAHVRKSVGNLRNLVRLSAEEAAQTIYRDGIDILVDLAGHTAGRTLPILACRPAPVQISGIGYFASTGLSTVDYFLADPILAAGAAEEGFTEELLVLPHTHFCWQPLHTAPAPAHVPAAGRSIVFGSFNNFTKLNDRVLQTWAEILRRVPGSRLLFKTDVFSYPDAREEALARIAAAGIPMDRVEAEGASRDYLAAYHRMDIALDPFPYPGGGTTCDALYMGVPVVTLAGDSLGSRFGASLLENIGAGALIAHTEEEYVERAVSLAGDSALLDALHAGLRGMMEKSPVMDAAGYGRDVGAAYEAVWKRYAERSDALKSPAAYDDSMIMELASLKDCIFAALAAERYAEAEQSTARALAAGAEDDMLRYLHAYAVERQGDLPRAMVLAEDYIAAGRTKLRHEFMRLRAAVAYRMGDVRTTEFYRRAYEEEPEDPSLYSSILLAQNAQTVDEEELFRAHLGYARLFDRVPRYTDHVPHAHEKIRVGYISPDFRRNVMQHFVQPLLTAYDRARFEVYAYSTAETPDEVTAALRPHVTVWRDMGGAAPEEIAARIHCDEIDILVDLAGHAAHGALPVLARRPAPVQMMGLGYMATSGLSEVDAFLTDEACDPVGGASEKYFTERLIRLPSQFVYVPRAGLPAAAGTPAKKRGHILFGVFNQYRKFTDDMLLLWREILARVPRAQLLLKTQIFFAPAMAEEARERLLQIGFDPARVILEPATTDYMERYLDVDIALDTYPWPGGGTTCDALYMGVPVVTMFGARRSTRFSYALLHHVGLESCAVQAPEDYVKRAAALAGDLDGLDRMHKELRTRMERSAIMDQQGYMKALERAYEDALHCTYEESR